MTPCSFLSFRQRLQGDDIFVLVVRVVFLANNAASRCVLGSFSLLHFGRGVWGLHWMQKLDLIVSLGMVTGAATAALGLIFIHITSFFARIVGAIFRLI